MISNSSITYNLTSAKRYIILNGLVFGTEYNISVAAVNSAGRGYFSDPIIVEIGIGMYNIIIISYVMLYCLVPGPVGSVSSIMDTTWAVISWSAPSYILSDYPIITYEIGHLQADNCSMIDDDDVNIQVLNQYNVSNNNSFTTITGLNSDTCYNFGVRACTENECGSWTFTTNVTFELLIQSSPVKISPSSMIKSFFTAISSLSVKSLSSSSVTQTSGISAKHCHHNLYILFIFKTVAVTIKPDSKSSI